MNDNIQRREIMTNSDLIQWLEVLGKGYVKPDSTKGPTSNATGVVWETKFYMPFIMSINSELCQRAGVTCPDIAPFLEFK